MKQNSDEYYFNQEYENEIIYKSIHYKKAYKELTLLEESFLNYNYSRLKRSIEQTETYLRKKDLEFRNTETVKEMDLIYNRLIELVNMMSEHQKTYFELQRKEKSKKNVKEMKVIKNRMGKMQSQYNQLANTFRDGSDIIEKYVDDYLHLQEQMKIIDNFPLKH